MNKKLEKLFKIKYPIIQGGMVWCSGWKLASCVSNSGGLGLIGAGSMTPYLLQEHILKCQNATKLPFGVNIPLLYSQTEAMIDVIINNNVKIVFTSAGNPRIYTELLKKNGITVVHVVSSVKFAKKAEEAGVDALVAEGFEAGGHNGREETTTFCLVPAIKNQIKIPLIAAGGIWNGRTMFGALALGADGVQIGSRFAITEESSAHDNFKRKIIESSEGETMLTLEKITPVRMIKNKFYYQIENAISKGAKFEEIKKIAGKNRAKLGIFEGNIDEGKLEIGQVAAYINSIKSAKDILNEIWEEFQEIKKTFFEQ